MPKIIKNNIVYGSGAKYVELTKLQYDQLTDAEKHNGKMYFITDANGDEQNFQPVIYSTTEREIGVWIDGNPLYIRTFNLMTKSLSNGSWNTSILGTNGSGIVIRDFQGTFTVNGRLYADYIYYRSSGEYLTAVLNADNSDLEIRPNISGVTMTAGICTIQYTKSSDIAGSGTWTPQGVPAIHYSTEEHIIGTWIDGSIIFEKTMNPTCSVGDNTLNHNISNFGRLVSIEGVCKYNNGSEYLYLPYTSTSSSYAIYISNVTSTTYKVGVGSGFSSIQDCYVTIRYTKTS